MNPCHLGTEASQVQVISKRDSHFAHAVLVLRRFSFQTLEMCRFLLKHVLQWQKVRVVKKKKKTSVWTQQRTEYM